MNILVKGSSLNVQPPKPVDESFDCAPTVISASFVGEEDQVMSRFDWIIELRTIFDRSKAVRRDVAGPPKISQNDLLMNIELYHSRFPLKPYDSYRETTSELGISVTDFK